MLCRDCDRRRDCVAPCPALEAELDGCEKSLQELPLSPEAAAHAAEQSLFTLADLQPDQTWPWQDLALSFPALSNAQVELFVSRFFDHRSVAQLAAERGLHRVTVCRQLRLAARIIQEDLEMRAARVEPRGR